MKLIQEKILVDFTTQKSRVLFNNLRLPDDFLEYPAAQWKHQPSFSTVKSLISTLAVTNDHAERAIALAVSQRMSNKYSLFRVLLLNTANNSLTLTNGPYWETTSDIGHHDQGSCLILDHDIPANEQLILNAEDFVGDPGL